MTKKIFGKYKRFGFFGMLRVVMAAVKYYFYRNILKQSHLVRRIHDFKLDLDLTDLGISRELIVNGTREEQLRYILNEEIKSGMTILDIGGNIGYYPVMEAKLVGDSGRIYTVEPAHDNYKQLLKNIRLNDLIETILPYNIGISNRRGKERFYLSTHSNLHTFIKKGYLDNYVTKGISDDTIEIEVTDLSSFLMDIEPIDLIRMDIEGYEVEVISGLEGAIKNGVFYGKIIFECHFPKYDDDNHSMREQLSMLFENNYRVKTMTSNDESVSQIKEFGYTPNKLIRTGDFTYQGIYSNITNEDALALICELGGVRDVLLVKSEKNKEKVIKTPARTQPQMV